MKKPNVFFKYFLNRLKEPSSWRGIVLILTICGISLDKDQQEAIMVAGLALVGLIGAFAPDKPPVILEPLIEPEPPPVQTKKTTSRKVDEPIWKHSREGD